MNKAVSLDLLSLCECEEVLLDISRSIRKPMRLIKRPNAMVAVVDQTILNVWPGQDVNMRFPWNDEHAVDSLEFTCSRPGGYFTRGHIHLRHTKMSYLELKEELMSALVEQEPVLN